MIRPEPWPGPTTPTTSPSPPGAPVLTLTIHGTPVPQGSHQGYVIPGKNGGKPRAVVVDDNKRTVPWRQDVTAAALNTIAEHPDTYPLTGPVQVVLEFRLPRIKGHYRTGAHAHQLRPDAPAYSSKKPDVDKLQRAILDALTNAGVWHDDGQVAVIVASKMFAAPGHTGVTISVAPMNAVPGVVVPPTAPGAVQSADEQGVLL